MSSPTDIWMYKIVATPLMIMGGMIGRYLLLEIVPSVLYMALEEGRVAFLGMFFPLGFFSSFA